VPKRASRSGCVTSSAETPGRAAASKGRVRPERRSESPEATSKHSAATLRPAVARAAVPGRPPPAGGARKPERTKPPHLPWPVPRAARAGHRRGRFAAHPVSECRAVCRCRCTSAACACSHRAAGRPAPYSPNPTPWCRSPRHRCGTASRCQQTA
jgi:hypothetical protein